MNDSFCKNAANHVPLSPSGFLVRSADVHPDRLAVSYGSIRFTYSELRERCLRLASALVARGLSSGDVVSVLAPNVPAHLEAHFGVPMAGAVLHSINIRLDVSTIAFMLRHAGSRLLLADAEFLPLARAAVQASGSAIEIIAIEDPSVVADVAGFTTYEALLHGGDPLFEPLTPCDEWDAIALNYTSGTTGNPKGVVYHHRGAYLNALANTLAWSLAQHPVYLWTLPLFHCNGWCFPWTITLLAGTHVCIRKLDEETLISTIADEKVTHLAGAPIVLSRIVNAAPAQVERLPRGLAMMVAGAPPTAAVIAAAERVGLAVTQTYGLTEVYGPCVVCEWKAEWDDLPPSDRARLKARQGVRYHIQESMDVLDPLTMAPVAADGATLGEIMIRGNIAMKGYLDNSAATDEAFAGGWFHTGDLAVKHPDGYVEIRDRSKDIIISGGENISTVEVEGVLTEHPGILEAAVVARRDEKWGETPCAFVTLRPGCDLDPSEVIAFCRDKLAGYKVPKTILFGDIPKTATGKVQKFVLREQANAYGREQRGAVAMIRPQFIDISMPISNDVVTDPPIIKPTIEYSGHDAGAEQMLPFFPGLKIDDLPDREGWATERLTLSTHSGSHMDAPWHYHSTTDEGRTAAPTIDEAPLDLFWRPGVKLDFRHFADGYVASARDVADELERIGHDLQPLDIVLVNTAAGAAYGGDRYVNSGCGMGREATLYLTERGVKVVGTDAWSWDAPFSFTAERYARTADASLIWEGHKAGRVRPYFQMEKLHNLEALPPCGFTVACFPVKIERASAGWVRAVAILPAAD